MTRRLYLYIGPAALAATTPAGALIASRDDLTRWLSRQTDDEAERDDQGRLIATFTVDEAGLRLAPRRSEHVRCVGGGPVLAAGELWIGLELEGAVIEEATNQSAGFAPAPKSWPALAAVLDAAGIPRPEGWARSFLFRRCPSCAQLNIVKDLWFVCGACDGALEEEEE